MDDVCAFLKSKQCTVAAPPGRTGHIAVTYGKYMLVWGGYKENPGALANTYFSGSELWVYSCESGKWYLKRTNSDNCHPPGMSGSAAVVVEDYMYLFGGYGYNGEGCTNKLYRLNLKTFNWESLDPTGIPPIPVDKTVAWTYGGKIYIFGGFGNPDNGPAHDFQFVFYHLLWRGWTNQFFEYDPEKNHWSRPTCTGDPPSARAAHAACVVQDKVYIFGGRHNMHRLNDLHFLDMDHMHWSGELPTTGVEPEGRSWHSLTGLDDRYLILYGGFSQHNVALSDCWMFDTKIGQWKQLELPFVKPRLWHCACYSCYNEVLIYGGCTSNILDLERAPEQATEILFIRITPKSLFRLCMDRMLEMPKVKSFWKSLPQNIQSLLKLRTASIPPQGNADGS